MGLTLDEALKVITNGKKDNEQEALETIADTLDIKHVTFSPDSYANTETSTALFNAVKNLETKIQNAGPEPMSLAEYMNTQDERGNDKADFHALLTDASKSMKPTPESIARTDAANLATHDIDLSALNNEDLETTRISSEGFSKPLAESISHTSGVGATFTDMDGNNNIVYNSAGISSINTTDGDDLVLAGTTYDGSFDGGQGKDTIVLPGSEENYYITTNEQGVTTFKAKEKMGEKFDSAVDIKNFEQIAFFQDLPSEDQTKINEFLEKNDLKAQFEKAELNDQQPNGRNPNAAVATSEEVIAATTEKSSGRE